MKKYRVLLQYAIGCAAVAVLYHFIGCPFRFLFGVPCPGCGITRACVLAVKGELGRAFAMHPLFLVLPPYIVLLIYKKGSIFANKAWDKAFNYTVIAIVIAVYIYRMVTLFPHTAPMVFNDRAIFIRIINFFK